MGIDQQGEHIAVGYHSVVNGRPFLPQIGRFKSQMPGSDVESVGIRGVESQRFHIVHAAVASSDSIPALSAVQTEEDTFGNAQSDPLGIGRGDSNGSDGTVEAFQ